MKFNWGTAIVVFFGIFVTLAIAFVVFSLQYSNDLVVDDYYEKGANYDYQMQIDKRSALYVDSVSVESDDTDVKLVLAHSIPAHGTQIQAWFYYPSNKKMDVLAEVEGTELTLQKKVFAHGRYTLKLSWMMNDLPYQVTHDFFVN